MLGYITAKEAIACGFTNHGKYYGIPLWIADNEDFVVAAKWYPMEYVITAMHYIEGFIRSVLYPDDEPIFQFLIGPPINEHTKS